MAKNLEGKNCPKFCAEATNEQTISNETYKGYECCNLFLS